MDRVVRGDREGDRPTPRFDTLLERVEEGPLDDVELRADLERFEEGIRSTGMYTILLIFFFFVPYSNRFDGTIRRELLSILALYTPKRTSRTVNSLSSS